MGGWPTIAFLTPAGEVLTGATYLPPDQLLTVLAAGARVLRRPRARAGRGGGRRDGPRTCAATPRAGPPTPATADLGARSAAAAVCRAVAALYDPLHGGLGAEPKFPQPDALGLLLAAAVRGDDERLLAMALHSLDAMAAGELHDAVEQGFFRYATRRDWSAPHYEKLLDDNARLALLYLDAFAFTGRAPYAEVAAGVIDYLTTVLRAPDAPVFFGSQDADEHYYSYDAAGRGRVPVKPAHRPHRVRRRQRARRARPAARRDPARAARPARRRRSPRPTTSGTAATDATAMVHYLGGPVDGLLADQAQMAAALLDAYEVSGERAYLARARLLADWALERLRARDGRFTDRPLVPGAGAGAAARDAPLPVLEGGAEMADDLTRLAAFSGVPAYREEAAGALAAYASDAADGRPAGRAVGSRRHALRRAPDPHRGRRPPRRCAGRRAAARRPAHRRTPALRAAPRPRRRRRDRSPARATPSRRRRARRPSSASPASVWRPPPTPPACPSWSPARRRATEALLRRRRRAPAGTRPTGLPAGIVSSRRRTPQRAALGRRPQDEARCACSRSTRPNGARTATGCGRC